MSADDAMNPWFADDGVGAPRRAEIPAPVGGSAPLTGGAEVPPPGRIERLAGTGVFKVLKVLSIGLALLLLLLGLAFAPLLLLLPTSAVSWMLAALLAGGLLGLLGLLRGSEAANSARTGRVELTIVLLAAGIASALVPIGLIAVSLYGVRDPAGLALAAGLAMPFVILILTATAAIQRVKREYARRVGERFDTLPVVLLLVSLAMMVAVGVVIGALQMTHELALMAS